ncbi:restriction endonuclease subunit S [Prevotella sp. P6B1]|uniref:restriction endonuclease subunit S n=1 Tax=Prevotella sp. P6B1 TaxID=1410613 RepID=UPI00051C0E18|nr:restriction endonuclease subunit S [Prevotella sp. P6B1]
MDKSKWEYKKLGEVATFERGLTYSKKDESDSSTKGVLRSNNIDLDSHQLVFDEIKWLNETFEIPQSKKLAKDSIFICMSNGSKTHLGKVAFIDKDYDYAFGGFMGMIKPLNIYPKYLFYYFLSKEYRDGLEQIGKGANINNLRFAQLANFMIPNPITEVQQRIVAELDCLNEMIALKQEQLKEFDKLAQSIFYDMFGDSDGYEKVKLGDVVEVVSGLVDPNTEPYCSQLHVSPANIVGGTNEIVNCVQAKSEGLISDKYPFKAGMILYSKIRPNLNKVAIARFDGICSADMYPLSVLPKANNVYITKLLSSKQFLDYAIKNSGRARMPKLNRETLFSYSFNLPPLALQQQFAEKIQAIEAQKELVKKSIAETQQLLDSRMDYYFD